MSAKRIIGHTVGTPISINKLKEELGGGADLTGYATEEFVEDYAQPKGEYLPADQLAPAVNDALAQAKASGEFDGKDGADGSRWFSGTQVSIDGGFPVYLVTGAKEGDYYINTTTGNVYKAGSSVWEYEGNIKGANGVGISGASINANGQLVVSFTDSTSATLGKVVGADGKDGADGYTPVKGVDYFDGEPGYTPVKGVDYFDGTDGVSPTVATSKSGKVTTVTITDKNGQKTATINDGADGSSVTVSSVSESSADGGTNVVTFSDGKKLNVKNGSKGSAYTLTESDKAEIVDDVVAELDGKIPDYWYGKFTDSSGKTYANYLTEKIADITALQNEGGKDSFSFVVITDIHHSNSNTNLPPTNLGRISPLIAKEIMQKCNIKYVLILGDTCTRGLWYTKNEVVKELEEIGEMLAPIKHSMLRTQGNHDGNYGEKDGVEYVYRMLPNELFGYIYRPVGLVGDVHFDASGSGYWIDDVSMKVRYIVLNTHNTVYEENDDGTQKYPNMKLFRFGQSQFDMVEDALNTVPSNDWSVVMAGHVALGTNGGYSPWGGSGEDGTKAECRLMEDMLIAYKRRESYSGKFGASPGVKNFAVINSTNTTDDTIWINGKRISTSGSGISAESSGKPSTLSNKIEIDVGETIRVEGVEFRSGSDRFGCYYENGNVFGSGTNYVVKSDSTLGSNDYVQVTSIGNGYEFKLLKEGTTPVAYMRFSFTTPDYATLDPDSIRITKLDASGNEVLDSGGGDGVDSVTVDADFSNAKGNLVAFFGGHTHTDSVSTYTKAGTSTSIKRITTRCDAKEENTSDLKGERAAGTITEQSFDVFTVSKIPNSDGTRTIHATKIGAGVDRTITY